MSKINFLKIKHYFDIFSNKKIIKNNYNHNHNIRQAFKGFLTRVFLKNYFFKIKFF
jgi:hypothetical protein